MPAHVQISASATGASLNQNQCGYSNVYFERAALANGFDYCQPLSKVMAYFKAIGFEFDPRFSLTVTSQLDVKRAHSYGFFDATNGKIVIFRIGEKKPWDLRWSERVYSSIVIHELIHMAVLNIMGDDYLRLPKEWHEFIAYSVQIDLLDEPLRKTILNKNNDITYFQNLFHVNPYIYGLAGSDLFSVKSYKTYQRHGGPTFIRDILQFKFRPPPFIDIFPLSER